MNVIRVAIALWALMLATTWLLPRDNIDAVPETVTVSGIVEVAEEDLDGSAAAVFLSTPDGEYYVESTGPAIELLAWVGDRVTVTGTVYEDGRVGPILRVAEIRSSED